MPASPTGLREHLAATPRGLGSLHAWVFFLLLAFALPAHAANYILRFTPSPSPDVEGYVVYRGNTSGSYDGGTFIGNPPQSGNPPESSYELTELDPNDTYYVVMTARNFDGIESVDSNELEIACLSGNCNVVVPECRFDSECNDGNACTVDRCGAGGTCTSSVNVGATCNDGDSGTIGDVCSAGGTCSGVPPVCNSDSECDDGNVCTVDQCDPFAGCGYTNVANGTSCDDANACTVNEVCTAGSCGGGTIPVSSGYYELDVDSKEHAIYDMSGGYDGVNAFDFNIDYDLAMNSRGGITGSGLATHPLIGSPIPTMVYGNASRTNEVLYLSLTFRLYGPGVNITLSQQFSIHLGNDTYSLTSSAIGSVNGKWVWDRAPLYSMPISTLPWALPDGAWTLILDVVDADGSFETSGADLELSNGVLIPLDYRTFVRSSSRLLFWSSDRYTTMNVDLDELLVGEAGPWGGIQYKVLGQGSTAQDWTEVVRDTCEE